MKQQLVSRGQLVRLSHVTSAGRAGPEATPLGSSCGAGTFCSHGRVSPPSMSQV